MQRIYWDNLILSTISHFINISLFFTGPYWFLLNFTALFYSNFIFQCLFDSFLISATTIKKVNIEARYVVKNPTAISKWATKNSPYYHLKWISSTLPLSYHPWMSVTNICSVSIAFSTSIAFFQGFFFVFHIFTTFADVFFWWVRWLNTVSRRCLHYFNNRWQNALLSLNEELKKRIAANIAEEAGINTI